MNNSLLSTPHSLHARPIASFNSPHTVLCQTFLRQEKPNISAEAFHLELLIENTEFKLIEQSKRYSTFQHEGCQLNLEIHNEFICYIWILSNDYLQKSIELFIESLPTKWLVQFPGKLLTQTCIKFEKSSIAKVPITKLVDRFGDYQLIGNFVEGQSARVWTSFNRDKVNAIHHFYVEDFKLGPRRTGRLAQNVIELENYRILASLAFPIAEEIIFALGAKEYLLTNIIKKITHATDTKLEKELFNQLLDLSVISEDWRSQSSHRFSASRAYRRIFMDRLSELDEEKVLGYQSLSKFLTRSSLPAFRSCDAANDRLHIFISKIDRATELLATRIRVTSEAQNQALLKSTNQQIHQQMVLQETIEAFSIIAISYYASSLVKYLLEAIKQWGIPINTTLWAGFSVPIIVLVTSFTMRHIRRRKTIKSVN